MEDVLIEEHSRLGIPYRPKPRSMVEAEVAVYHAADHITVASTYARSTFIERGLHPDRISVIPYGVDLEQFSPRPGVSRNGFRVLFVGRLSVLKGVHYLVAAMRQANIRAGSLTLVGSVLPETEHLLAGTQDIDLDVHGPVARAALPDFFSQADVMVLPSLSDGFGLVIGQALACGCPVIATESTGGRDILRDGVNGFIVTSRSAAAIAEKLVWLHEHPAEREAMRARAVDSVRSVGGWDDYGDALVQLFARLSGERR
jgi:glycosyltransferase involved in cell wall biosynthesis